MPGNNHSNTMPDRARHPPHPPSWRLPADALDFIGQFQRQSVNPEGDVNFTTGGGHQLIGSASAFDRHPTLLSRPAPSRPAAASGNILETIFGQPLGNSSAATAAPLHLSYGQRQRFTAMQHSDLRSDMPPSQERDPSEMAVTGAVAQQLNAQSRRTSRTAAVVPQCPDVEARLAAASWDQFRMSVVQNQANSAQLAAKTFVPENLMEKLIAVIPTIAWKLESGGRFNEGEGNGGSEGGLMDGQRRPVSTAAMEILSQLSQHKMAHGGSPASSQQLTNDFVSNAVAFVLQRLQQKQSQQHIGQLEARTGRSIHHLGMDQQSEQVFYRSAYDHAPYPVFGPPPQMPDESEVHRMLVSEALQDLTYHFTAVGSSETQWDEEAPLSRWKLDDDALFYRMPPDVDYGFGGRRGRLRPGSNSASKYGLIQLQITMPIVVPNATIAVTDPMGGNSYDIGAQNINGHILFGRERGDVPQNDELADQGADINNANVSDDPNFPTRAAPKTQGLYPSACDMWASFLNVSLGTIVNLDRSQLEETCRVFQECFADQPSCRFLVPIAMDCRGIFPVDSLGEPHANIARATRFETSGTMLTENDRKRFRILRRQLKKFSLKMNEYFYETAQRQAGSAGVRNNPPARVVLDNNCRSSNLTGNVRVTIRRYSPITDKSLLDHIKEGSSKLSKGEAFDLGNGDTLPLGLSPQCRVVMNEMRLELTHARMVDPRWPNSWVLARKMPEVKKRWKPEDEGSSSEAEFARFIFCDRVQMPQVVYEFANPKASLLSTKFKDLFLAHSHAMDANNGLKPSGTDDISASAQAIRDEASTESTQGGEAGIESSPLKMGPTDKPMNAMHTQISRPTDFSPSRLDKAVIHGQKTASIGSGFAGSPFSRMFPQSFDGANAKAAQISHAQTQEALTRLLQSLSGAASVPAKSAGSPDAANPSSDSNVLGCGLSAAAVEFVPKTPARLDPAIIHVGSRREDASQTDGSTKATLNPFASGFAPVGVANEDGDRNTKSSVNPLSGVFEFPAVLGNSQDVSPPRFMPLTTEPCRYFLLGSCARGDNCYFLHPADDTRRVCSPNAFSQSPGSKAKDVAMSGAADRVDVRHLDPSDPLFF